jgi:hypothetical protein
MLKARSSPSIIFFCPNCGRTVSLDSSGTTYPNTVCSCSYPDSLTLMVEYTPIPSNHVDTPRFLWDNSEDYRSFGEIDKKG